MGILIFWLQYVVAGILLYHILRCIYIKKDTDTRGYKTKYRKTENDERLKHPLWLLIIAFIILTIPFLNIFVFGFYLSHKVICESGEEYNPYYCKSAFTKKY